MVYNGIALFRKVAPQLTVIGGKLWLKPLQKTPTKIKQLSFKLLRINT